MICKKLKNYHCKDIKFKERIILYIDIVQPLEYLNNSASSQLNNTSNITLNLCEHFIKTGPGKEETKQDQDYAAMDMQVSSTVIWLKVNLNMALKHTEKRTEVFSTTIILSE